MIKRKTLTTLTVIFALSQGASLANAAPADDARAHFDAIASGDVAAVMEDYSDHA